jgi:hypothetical protein
MPRKNSDQTGRDEVPPTVGMFSSDEMEKAPDGARGPRQRKAKPKEDPKAEYGPSPTEPDSSKPDPFDPKRFRIDPQNKEALAQRVWTDGQIAIRKPNDQEWFRVRTGVDPEGEPWIMPETPILQRRADGKYRLLTPDIAPAVKQAKLVTLRFCISSHLTEKRDGKRPIGSLPLHGTACQRVPARVCIRQPLFRLCEIYHRECADLYNHPPCLLRNSRNRHHYNSCVRSHS